MLVRCATNWSRAAEVSKKHLCAIQSKNCANQERLTLLLLGRRKHIHQIQSLLKNIPEVQVQPEALLQSIPYQKPHSKTITITATISLYIGPSKYKQ